MVNLFIEFKTFIYSYSKIFGYFRNFDSFDYFWYS